MTFAARYPGLCPQCAERIHEGDEVRFDDGQVVHGDCDTVPADLAPRPVCTKCWLEKPCGCDD